MAATPAGLPEREAVYWRPAKDAERLRKDGRLWTLTTTAHAVPFVLTAVGLVLLEPLAAPVSAIALVKAWIIPELYAARGANVVRPRRRTARHPASPERSGLGSSGCKRQDSPAEATALGLLGDLVGHEAREVHAQTGLVPERGTLGVWLVGEAGALLVRQPDDARPTRFGEAGRRARRWRAGRRVHCFCVRATGDDLPAADRTAHLLLALRTDEEGFATVANQAFSGARWRVRRRIPREMRPALDFAARQAVEPELENFGPRAQQVAA